MNNIIEMFKDKSIKSMMFTRLSYDSIRVRTEGSVPTIQDIEIDTLKRFRYTVDGEKEYYDKYTACACDHAPCGCLE